MKYLRPLKFVRFTFSRCYGIDSTQIRAKSVLSNGEIKKKRNGIFDEELANQRSLVTRMEKIEVHVTGPPEDSTLLMNKDISTPYDCARHINEVVTKQSALAVVDGKLWDMHRPLKDTCKLEFLHFKQNDPTPVNKVFWRSCSFILGMVIEKAFREEFFIELHSWPFTNIKSGSFVYDADIKMENWVPTMSELQVLTTLSRRFCAEDKPFQRLEVDASVALKMFEDNRFKAEQIPFIAANSPSQNKVILYRVADHIDISSGPMIANINLIHNFAIAAVHKLETDDGELYRFQGLALPTQILLNPYAFSVLLKRAAKLQTFSYSGASDTEEKHVSN